MAIVKNFFLDTKLIFIKSKKKIPTSSKKNIKD